MSPPKFLHAEMQTENPREGWNIIDQLELQKHICYNKNDKLQTW